MKIALLLVLGGFNGLAICLTGALVIYLVLDDWGDTPWPDYLMMWGVAVVGMALNILVLAQIGKAWGGL